MPSATSLLVALVVIALIGALGTLYFWTIRRRQDEALNGVRALSAMRWREFSHFVHRRDAPPRLRRDLEC